MKNTVIYDGRNEVRNKPTNLKSSDSNLFQHEYNLNLKPVSVVEIKNVSILKGFLFSIKSFNSYIFLTHVFDVKKKFILRRIMTTLFPAHKLEDGIWITDEISSEYFHWFTDALSRLKAIDKAFQIKRNLTDDVRPQVILPLDYKRKEFIVSSLKILGYEAFYYNPKKRLKVKRLITSTHTAPTGNYNSDIIKELRASFMPSENKSLAHRKIYISRSKAMTRKVINEAEVIDLLIKYGYEIHTFEDYDFNKQLEIMFNVKTLVSIHGAGLTNMLFMPAEGNILELRNEGDSHNNCYFSLSSSLNHRYFYLVNKGDRKDTYSVNITVDLEELAAIIDKVN
jgi:capsular polysaccharide biosynthesis protein